MDIVLKRRRHCPQRRGLRWVSKAARWLLCRIHPWVPSHPLLETPPLPLPLPPSLNLPRLLYSATPPIFPHWNPPLLSIVFYSDSPPLSLLPPSPNLLIFYLNPPLLPLLPSSSNLRSSLTSIYNYWRLIHLHLTLPCSHTLIHHYCLGRPYLTFPSSLTSICHYCRLIHLHLLLPSSST